MFSGWTSVHLLLNVTFFKDAFLLIAFLHLGNTESLLQLIAVTKPDLYSKDLGQVQCADGNNVSRWEIQHDVFVLHYCAFYFLTCTIKPKVLSFCSSPRGLCFSLAPEDIPVRLVHRPWNPVVYCQVIKALMQKYGKFAVLPWEKYQIGKNQFVPSAVLTEAF